MMPTQISAERIRLGIENRINYIRQATPQRIAMLLDGYYVGGFEIAKLWDALERRNPDIATVVGKRKADVGRMDWQVLVRSDLPDGRTAEAQRHADVLKAFYDEVRVTNVLKQDETGGVGMLAQQILDARGKEYSVHEWIWRLPSRSRGRGLGAEFRHCPMWWFENRTGRLRYLTDDGQMYGVEMRPQDWLVTAAPAALMEATTVAWMFTHACLNDWLAFCDKFGMPGLLGKTDAAPGSKEWEAMVTAVREFGHDWAAVVNREAGIEVIGAGSASGQAPYEPLVEAMRRSIITLWRGGDLSTLSATQGQGQGASVQGAETNLLQEDDARFVSEKLQERVDRLVIQYYFGPEAEPLAYFHLQPPTQPDIDRELKVDEMFLRHGLALRRADLYERYSRRQPAPDDPPEAIVVGGSPAPMTVGSGGPLGLANVLSLLNAAAEEAAERADRALLRNAGDKIAAAEAEVLASLRGSVVAILEMDDPAMQRMALQSLRAELPAILQRAGLAESAHARAIEGLLGSATLNGYLSVPELPEE